MDPAGNDPARTIAPRLTPRYASPEQFAGQAITAATDIYSLGVVMYEVLTGRNPFAGLAGPALIQAVCKGEAPAPALRRDLASVVLKAIAKDTVDRYPSAMALSADIEHYQRGEPVSAVQATPLYRASRYLSRNWVPLAIAAGVLLLVGAGFGRAYWSARQAAQRFDQVHKLAHSLLFEIHDEVNKVPGTLQSRQIILTRALEYLDQLASDQSVDAALQMDLAESYIKVGEVQGTRQSEAETLRQWRDAKLSFQKAGAILERLRARDRTNRELRNRLAFAYRQIGETCLELRDAACEREGYGKSVSLYEEDTREHRQDAEAEGRWLAARVRANVMPLYRESRFAEAEPEMKSVVQGFEDLGRRAPDARAMRVQAPFAFGWLGLLYTRMGKHESAIEWYRKDQEYNRNADNAERDIEAEEGIAWNYVALGESAEAAAAYGRCVEISRKLAKGRGEDRSSRLRLASNLSAWGQPLVDVGRWREALTAAQEALQILEPLRKNADQDQSITDEIAAAHLTLGNAYWKGSQKTVSKSHYATFLDLVGARGTDLYPEVEIEKARKRIRQ
jgi:tetratricopeptide (TPR) repeat protein